MFSKHNRVIYFEPAHSIKYLVKKPAILWEKVVGIFGGERKINENLFVFRSPPILPFGNRSHIVNCINQIFILLVIRIFIKDFEEKKKLLLWINDPIHYPMIKFLKPKISVYDCTDAFIFRDAKKQVFHDRLRRRTIRKSSLSFFTSELYFNEGREYSHNCHYVPNGVDIKNSRKRDFTVPDEIKMIKRPILGFVGSLDLRIDQNLIKEILVKKPDVSLVFVGPIIGNFCEFEKIDRVFLLGKRDYKEIPDFIKQFDVALIVYPVKLHEYLILGKPVVSTNINEVMQFSEVVYVADSRDAFIEKITLALNERDKGERKKRIQTALKNTWAARLRKINRELNKVGKNQE
jgi:glycosyltransferase involved in cell wall biosynthesis